jgi:hypothetical protein
MKKIDLDGKKFHRLTVIKQVPHEKGEIKWECLCDCGKTKLVTRNKLLGEKVKSCGCLNNELRKSRTGKMTQARTKYNPQEATARRVWGGRYRDGNISFEQFLNLASKNCYYCGSPPNNKYNEASGDKRRSATAKAEGLFIYNGLDRLNQSLAHNIDNVVTCCKLCNMTKRNMNHDQFIELITKIYYNMKDKL